MPVRRINFTRRRRIRREDVVITLHPDEDGQYSFDIVLGLAEYGFPADALVCVEAYRQTSIMRFNLGTPSLLRRPTDTRLLEFTDPAGVLFRVRVTDTTHRKGLLLGEADRIRAECKDRTPDRRVSLLPIAPDALGEEVWRIDFTNEPILLVNQRLQNWRETVQSDAFRALVYPSALRLILDRILRHEKWRDFEDRSNWCSRWLLFASRIPGAGVVPGGEDPDQDDEWIDIAVAAFARQYEMHSRFAREQVEYAA